jgi:transcriptional regulator with XRE-family HTH domain
MPESRLEALRTIELALLGQRLICARRSAGLSLGQTVKLSGFSRAQLGEWEAGAIRPASHHFMALCSIYHCTIEDVLGDMPEFASLDAAIAAFNEGKIGDLELSRYMKCGTTWARMKADYVKSLTCDHNYLELGINARLCTKCNHYDANI